MEKLYLVLTKDFDAVRSAVDKTAFIKHWFFNSSVGLFVVTDLDTKELFAVIEKSIGKNTFFITRVYDKPGEDFWGRLPTKQWENFPFRKKMFKKIDEIDAYVKESKADDRVFFAQLAQELNSKTINADQLRAVVYDILLKSITHEQLLSSDELSIQRLKETIARDFVKNANAHFKSKTGASEGDKVLPE
jgi:hypothetical protein